MRTEQLRTEFEALASQHGLCVTEEGDFYRSHVVAGVWKEWRAIAAPAAHREQQEVEE